MTATPSSRSLFKKIGFIVICIFALIGFGMIAMYTAVQLGWTNTSGIIDSQHDYFKNEMNKGITSAASTTDSESSIWNSGAEWDALKAGILKDKNVIQKAANTADVPARLIVAPLIVEQLRLFHSEREVFKAIFGPLKMLGNQSQFSWGVMGIKQDTARQIETFLASTTSPWYAGAKYAHLLDYVATSSHILTTDDIDAARFARLTDENDRYYSYLYAGLSMKEIEAQWSHAGMPIDTGTAGGVGILATLYNIGFENSHPNAHPQIGGAEISIGSTTHSFGGLAQDFYDSNELIDVFPR